MENKSEASVSEPSLGIQLQKKQKETQPEGGYNGQDPGKKNWTLNALLKTTCILLNVFPVQYIFIVLTVCFKNQPQVKTQNCGQSQNVGNHVSF